MSLPVITKTIGIDPVGFIRWTNVPVGLPVGTGLEPFGTYFIVKWVPVIVSIWLQIFFTKTSHSCVFWASWMVVIYGASMSGTLPPSDRVEFSVVQDLVK